MPKKGYKLLEKHKRKIGLANSIALKGRKLSEKTKKKISQNNAKFWLRKKFSKEHCEKISEGHKRWAKEIGFSEEHKRKIRESKRNISEGIRKRMSEGCKKNGVGKWMKDRKLSEETKMKMSENNARFWKNKKLSEKHKKKISESNSGEKSYNWQGGKSFEPYSIDWTRSLRISIRERDKYTCQLCKEKQGDRAYSIHHIDYNKKNCNSNNLITLCAKCHTKTNHKRDYWIRYFKI